MDWTTSIHPLDDEAAQERWQALWESSPQRSSFSSLAYADAAARAFGLACEMHLVSDEDGDAAGALVYWRKRGPYKEAVIPPFTQYTPFLLRQPLAEAAVHARHSPLEALLRALESRFDVLRLFCFSLPDIRVASWRSWRVTPYYTYDIAFGAEPTLFRRWSEGTRRAFQKHVDAYHIDENAQAAATIVSLCSASYQRHGRALPTDHARLHALIDTLRAQGMVRLFTATSLHSSAPEGALALLHDGRTAHYWIAGSLPGPAMTVLLGRILPQLQEEGFLHFDFVGANTPSIAEFKRHFGPKLGSYFYLEYIARPELRLFYRLKGS